MDNVTKSLRKYLNLVNIRHTTLYNTDCGNKIEHPTSTCFILKFGKKSVRSISLVIDIFPTDQQFFISAHPNVVFEYENMDLIQALETKWNRSGFLTTLIIEEENGMIKPNTYCFKLMLSGFCDINGMNESLWEKYIAKVKEESSYIENHIKELSND